MTTLLLALLQTPVPAQVAPASDEAAFTQAVTAADGTVQMRTGARRLTAPGKPDVWLVGAVHIGTKAYYQAVQGLLSGEEVVLYEGVRPSAKAPAPTAKPTTTAAPPTPVYKTLSDALGLEFQQNHITYGHPGWKNVDLSWDDLDRINREASGGKPSQFDAVKGMLDPTSKLASGLSTFLGAATPGTKEAIKVLMVRSLANGGRLSLDPVANRVILSARNRNLIDGLAREVDKKPKSIAVLYGAAHLAEVQRALVAQYGYKLGETRWFTAATADPRKVDAQGQAFLDMAGKALGAAGSPAGKSPR